MNKDCANDPKQSIITTDFFFIREWPQKDYTATLSGHNRIVTYVIINFPFSSPMTYLFLSRNILARGGPSLYTVLFYHIVLRRNNA